MNLKKTNRVAIVVSNEALTALKWFSIESGFPDPALHSDEYSDALQYNDVVRWIYDALFRLNVECDVLPADATSETLARYSMVITPALYTTSADTIVKLREYVGAGGHLLSTFRSFVTNDHLAVWADRAPHLLTDVFGITYNQFTQPEALTITPTEGFRGHIPTTKAGGIIELLTPEADTQILAHYDHWAWGAYAAITRHTFGKGSAQWIATMAESIDDILHEALETAGIEVPSSKLPPHVRMRTGHTQRGTLTYFLNYSDGAVSFASPISGRNLLAATGAHITAGDPLTIGRWDLVIVESASLPYEPSGPCSMQANRTLHPSFLR